MSHTCDKMVLADGVSDQTDVADEVETLGHQVIMLSHLIVSICVFGLLGYMVQGETRRMKRLRVARDGAAGAVKQKPSGEHEAVTQYSSSYSRKLSRKFAAEYALYRMDYFLSTASFAKPLLLLLLTYIIIMVGGFVYSSLSGIPMLEALWMSWTMVADPGAHSDTQGTLLRGVSLGLTLAGMLVFALMIGIVADGVSNFLDSLKQGHAGVVEIEHTLILGWSQKTLPCIREICLANASLNGRGVIVVLADREKQAMEEELRAVFAPEDLRGTLVVCRSGRITSEKDLRKVSARHARSTIILADMSIAADASDARAVRVVMCLAKIFQEQESKVNGHLVVELCDVDNKDLIPLIAPMNCEVVVSHDMIGRMMIVSARQPGLTQVLQQMLTFDGAEFYFKRWPELTGKTFGEVHFLFKDAVVLGIKPDDKEDALDQLAKSKFPVDVRAKRNRRVLLNPPDDYVLREKDMILVLAEDDDCYTPCLSAEEAGEEARKALNSVKQVRTIRQAGSPESFLFCGSRRDMDDMIIELDQMVAAGSTLTLLSNIEIEKQKKRLLDGGLDLTQLKNLLVDFVQGNHVIRRDLEKLPLERYSSILILAEEDYESTMDEADSRTLTCLLLIRDIITKRLNLDDAPTVQSGKLKVMRTTIHQPAPPSSPGATPGDKPEDIDAESNATSKRSSIFSGSLLGGPSFAARRLKLKSPTLSSVGVALSRRSNSSGGGGDVYYEAGVHGDRLYLVTQEMKKELTYDMNPYAVSSRRAGRSNGAGDSTKSKSPSLQSISPSSFSPDSTRGPAPVSLGSIVSSSSSTIVTTATDSDSRSHDSVAKTIILCEILDTQTKALMPIAKVTDNLLSNEIISSCLSLIAESASINDVLSELLQPEGNDIKLVSSIDYGDQGEEISLWMLSARVRSRRELLLGYKIMGGDGKAILNPQDKTVKIVLNVRTMLIVIGEIST